MQQRLARVLDDAEEPLREGARAVRGLLHELRQAYGRLKDSASGG